VVVMPVMMVVHMMVPVMLCKALCGRETESYQKYCCDYLFHGSSFLLAGTAQKSCLRLLSILK
jgi:hypothetical protein